jgi:hypothetical protein
MALFNVGDKFGVSICASQEVIDQLENRMAAMGAELVVASPPPLITSSCFEVGDRVEILTCPDLFSGAGVVGVVSEVREAGSTYVKLVDFPHMVFWNSQLKLVTSTSRVSAPVPIPPQKHVFSCFEVGDKVEMLEKWKLPNTPLTGVARVTFVSDHNTFLNITYPCGTEFKGITYYMLKLAGEPATITRPYDNKTIEAESCVEVENYVDFTNIRIRDTL